MCVIDLQRKCLLAISKWRKVKTWKFFLRFLCFFDITLQKNVKSRVFWTLKKNKAYSRTMTERQTPAILLYVPCYAIAMDQIITGVHFPRQ